MITLFMSWQDPKSRAWHPIGRLSCEPDRFRFEYVRGVQDAQKQGFEPLPSFGDLDRIYEAETLFPLFSNRVLNASRPDYGEFLSWLGVADADGSSQPLELLARSGGQRVTDQLEVFPMPSALGDDRYSVRFFVHGLRHMSPDAVMRASSLESGNRLHVMHDFQNPVDRCALMLRNAESYDGDVYPLGYTPRYLFADCFDRMMKDTDWPKIIVEKVNPAPAPIQFRLLCRAEMQLDTGVTPFSGKRFRPVTAPDAVEVG